MKDGDVNRGGNGLHAVAWLYSTYGSLTDILPNQISNNSTYYSLFDRYEQCHFRDHDIINHINTTLVSLQPNSTSYCSSHRLKRWQRAEIMLTANKSLSQSAQSHGLIRVVLRPPPAPHLPRPLQTRVFSFFNLIFNQERIPFACLNCILMQTVAHAKTVQYVLLFVSSSTLGDSSFQYIRLPPAYIPYILRVSIEAGTPAARNGVFKTNFPLDGGLFGRDHFTKRR